MKIPIRIKIIVFLTAGTLLCYEISLIRVYAVTQWQNFFSIIVSMAMLGFGISGSILFILKKKIHLNNLKWILLCLFLYPLTLFLGFIVSSKFPFNPFLLGLENKEIIYLFISLLTIIIPFVFGSSVFGILIQKYNIHKLYSLNLIGSGVGAIAVIIIQSFMHPFHSLVLITGVCFLTSIIYSSFFRKKIIVWIITLSIISMLLIVISFDLLNLKKVSEFKSITQTLSIKNARILYEKYSPFGLIQVVEADGLRSFPGLSIISPTEVPLQKFIFFDGDGGSTVIPFSNRFENVEFLARMTSALPYVIRNPSLALIAGSGGGEGILKAMFFNCKEIDAVEVNKEVIKIMEQELLDFSGGIYLHPDVNVIMSDIRTYIDRTNKKYSLIELSFNDSYSGVASGVNALNESYIYTVESLENMYNKLDKDGLISITRWTVDPPRDNIKLLATAIRALKYRGINNLKEHIIAIRSLQTFTLIISKSKFSNKEVIKTKDFTNNNLFDLVYYPGIKTDEPNRHIKLVSPYYYNAANELFSSNANQYIKDHVFNIEPATDDKPYFYNFFKLKTIEHIRAYGVKWFPVTDWGYLLIFFIFLLVVIISFTGILLPIKLSSSCSVNIYIYLYFSLIAISYFFIEIALIQKSILYVGNPIYSASFIITGLLIFSGLGSYFSDRILKKQEMIFYTVIFITIALILHLVLYIFFTKSTGNWNIVGKILIMLISMFPLGFLMGVPFPLGLAVIKKYQPEIVPWAWGINGFFSVISILLTTILSILLGYKIVLLLACLIYITAGFVSKKMFCSRG